MQTMLRMVFFPWFFVRLVIVGSPTLAQIAYLPFRRWENLSIAIVVLSLVATTTLRLYPTLISSQNQPTAPLAALFGPNQEEAEKALNRYLHIYQLQPTDRDILLNIAQLYLTLGDQPQAERFQLEAQKVDPNFGYVTQNY